MRCTLKKMNEKGKTSKGGGPDLATRRRGKVQNGSGTRKKKEERRAEAIEN